ncbi:MAG: hypothetical protein ABI150_02340 [Nitrobacter sp.]
MKGPSLAELWGRKAGSLPGFDCYSDARKASGIVWNDQTLDQWLTDPQHVVPNDEISFGGIKDAGAQLLATLAPVPHLHKLMVVPVAALLVEARHGKSKFWIVQTSLPQPSV